MNTGSMPQFGKPTKQKVDEDPKYFGPPAISGDPFASTPTPFSIQMNYDLEKNNNQKERVEFHSDPISITETIDDYNITTTGDPFSLKPQPVPTGPIDQPTKPTKNKSSHNRPLKYIANATKKIEAAAGPNLALLCIIFAALALISSSVAVWAILSRNNNASNNTVSSITTSESGLAAKTLSFSQDKITNPLDETFYRLNSTRYNPTGDPVISAIMSKNGTTVDISVYWDAVRDYYNITTDKIEKETFSIDYEKKVSDIIIAQSGNTPDGDVILILLSDGSIQYIPVTMSIQTKSFSTSGRLNGVSDVAKFYTADGFSTNSGIVRFSTILAQKYDGSLVDLQSYIKSANGQKNTQ